LITLTVEEAMPRTKSTPPSDGGEPQPETVRIAPDLMRMIREVCIAEKDGRGRPLKITAVVDEILRAGLMVRHRRIAAKTQKKEPE